MKSRLPWRLFLSHMTVAVFCLVVMTVGAAHGLRAIQTEWTRRELEAAAAMAGLWVGASDPAPDDSGPRRAADALGRKTGYRITFVATDGRVLGDSEADPALMENHADRPELSRALAGHTGVSVRYSRTRLRRMMYVALPLAAADGTVRGAVRAALPVYDVEYALSRLRGRLFETGIMVLLAAFAVSLLVAARVGRPLERLRRAVEPLGRGAAMERVGSSGVEEVDALAETLRRMSDQLQDRLDTLARQRDEQGALFACMVEGVVAVDTAKRIIKMNRSAAEMFGIGNRDVTGRTVLEAVRNGELHGLIERTLRDRCPVEGDIYLAASDRHVQAHGTVLTRENGTDVGAVVVLNDITRLRKLEDMRRDFVENVSHELKTPITSIKGFAETLAEGDVQDATDRQRFLDIIVRQANRLHDIIQDMLTLSGMEHDAEERQIELKPAPLRPVLDAAIRSCRASADAAGVAFELACSEDLAAPINEPLLEQAVSNLLDNAVKYGAAGRKVEVVAEALESEVAIRVRDRGPGISERHLARLFERFYRIDKGRSRKAGGTGLGLAIVKRVALAHGGRVDVSSVVGEGSVFSIFLPR